MDDSTLKPITPRRLVLAGVLSCLGLLAAVGLGSPAQRPHHAALPAVVAGRYSLIHADGGRFDNTYTPVVFHDGKLVSAGDLGVAPGSDVVVSHGMLVSHTLRASTALGTHKLLIVPVVWGTKTIRGTQASDKTFGSGPLASWYKNASYGLFTWSASATPKVKIAAPTGGAVGTWLDQIATRANTRITALGYKPAAYNAILYETPTLIGGAAGYGMVPGRYAWVKTPLNIRVAAHELGHTLGLYHAHADECGNYQMAYTSDPTPAPSCFSVGQECGGATGTAGASCWEEYGDPFAAMGESWMQMSSKSPNAGSFDAPEKAHLGWVSAANGRELTVTQSGDYPISGYEAVGHSGPQAIKITTPNGTFWFEYRTWTGIDGVFQNYFSYYTGHPFPSSVLVHIDHPVNGGGDLGSLLLDTTPGTSDVTSACNANGLASLPAFCDAGLLNGTRFIDFRHLLVQPEHDNATGQEYLHVVFDSTGPDVGGIASTPGGGATINTTLPTFTVTAPASDADSGVAYYLLYLDDDINTNPPPTAVIPANGTLQWTPGYQLSTTSHSYTIVAVDWAGNFTVAPQQTFTIS